ncbi:MAG: hypothetical protein RR177_01795 [Oscillospiraceae bacterium]
MDNYKYYTSSLAHDYDMFMTSPKENNNKNADVIKYPSSKNKVKNQTKSASPRISAVLICALLLGMICANIYVRAEITSTKSEINGVKETISELASEEVRLQCDMERKISFQNLEESAAALGMQKKERSQIIYIKTNSESVAKNGKNEVLAKAE